MFVRACGFLSPVLLDSDERCNSLSHPAEAPPPVGEYERAPRQSGTWGWWRLALLSLRSKAGAGDGGIRGLGSFAWVE